MPRRAQRLPRPPRLRLLLALLLALARQRGRGGRRRGGVFGGLVAAGVAQGPGPARGADGHHRAARLRLLLIVR